MNKPVTGLPQLLVEGELLPEVWEKSVELLWEKGMLSWKESYKYGVDKVQIKECSMRMLIECPLKEPRLHMEWGTTESLEEYSKDLRFGRRDHMIGELYDYTYHERLLSYRRGEAEPPIDQLDLIVKKLTEKPYSNRAQAVTWIVEKDASLSQGPPCLQRIWCKVVGGRLEMHSDWRSRDAVWAAPSNMWALIDVQKTVAEKLGVEVGNYVDSSDSYHIYAEDFRRVEGLVRFFKERRIQGRSAWVNSQDPRFRE